MNVTTSAIPTIPPLRTSTPLPTDLHDILARSKAIRDAIIDLKDAGSQAHWLTTAEGLANSLQYRLHLLSVEYGDREKNLISAAFAAGRLSGVAQENSRKGIGPALELANRVWTQANEIHRALQDVDWRGPLVVVKRPCGCRVEKLSDEDPGSLQINCDEARALNRASNDAEGEYLAALLRQDELGQEEVERLRLASGPSYNALKAHFGGGN